MMSEDDYEQAAVDRHASRHSNLYWTVSTVAWCAGIVLVFIGIAWVIYLWAK